MGALKDKVITPREVEVWVEAQGYKPIREVREICFAGPKGSVNLYKKYFEAEWILGLDGLNGEPLATIPVVAVFGTSWMKHPSLIALIHTFMHE